MKHLSSILLAAAFVAGSVTACFKDPTSDSLSNGPSRIELTRSAITLRTGDSLTIEAEVKDAAGNVYSAAGAEWSSGDATIAIARLDTTLIPGSVFSRAFIRAVAAGGGATNITVTAAGVTNQFRVLVLPARLSASALSAVSGTTSVDTIVNVLPGGTVVRDIFTVGDTVTFSVAAGSSVYFSPTASQVSLGANRAYIVARTDSTRIKAIARAPFRGRPWITALHYNGPTEVGTVAIDSLQGDTVVIARPRLNGATSILGDTLTVTAATGSSFNATSSTVYFGATAATILARSTSQISVISPIAYTGQVTVRNVVVGSATVDSLKTNASYTIAKAAFPGTITTNGTLLDTVRVFATATAKFSLVSTALSNVTIGGAAAYVLKRTADSMLVVSRVRSTGAATISNVVVGAATIPSLPTAGNVVISDVTTGELNEDGNDTRAGATLIATPARSATGTDTVKVFGAVNADPDYDDFYSLVTTDSARIRATLYFPGTGVNPDIDVYVLSSTGSFIDGYSGGTAVNPETATTTAIRVPGTYYVLVEYYVSGTFTGANAAYMLYVRRLIP
jgi:hypothetical protein